MRYLTCIKKDYSSKVEINGFLFSSMYTHTKGHIHPKGKNMPPSTATHYNLGNFKMC